MLLKYFLLATISFGCIKAACDKELMQPIQWAGGAIAWPDKSIKALYTKTGLYVSKNMIATRGQVFGETAFLVLPRFKPGVAVTLAQTSLRAGNCDATLKPFPCLLSQQEGNCDAIQSAVDIFLDAQDVLWVLDVGVVNSLENPIRTCPPKVLSFSVKTGQLLKSIDLSGLVCEGSRLQYIAVEYADGRPFVYVSDAAARSVIAYDVIGNKGFRVVLPKAAASGCNKRDVLYVALVRKGCGNNYLIFTYLCGNRVFSIRTDHLRSLQTQGNILDLGPKPSKIVILGTDLGSAVFFRLEGQSDVFRWDSNECFIPANFMKVYKSPPHIMPSQVIPDATIQRMRVLGSNFPDYIQGTVGIGAVQGLALI